MSKAPINSLTFLERSSGNGYVLRDFMPLSVWACFLTSLPWMGILFHFQSPWCMHLIHVPSSPLKWHCFPFTPLFPKYSFMLFMNWKGTLTNVSLCPKKRSFVCLTLAPFNLIFLIFIQVNSLKWTWRKIKWKCFQISKWQQFQITWQRITATKSRTVPLP